MAIVSPSGLLGTRSPLLISWDGASTTSVDRFKLDIYAWTGDKDVRPADPIYTIDRTTGLIDEYPTADIAPLLQDEFIHRISKIDQDDFVVMSPDSLLWMEVDYRVEYQDKSTPPTSQLATGTTTRSLIVYGYSHFTDGANKDVAQEILMEDQYRYLYEFDTYNMPIYLGDVGSSYQTDAVKIKIAGSDGTSDEITISNKTGEDAQDRVLLFPVGVPNLSNFLFDNSLTGLTEPRLLDWWDVQILDSVNAVVDSRRFYNQCEPKYDPIQLQFINRLGMWDTLTFFKRSDDSISVSKERYRAVVGSASASGYTWGDQARGMRTYNHEAKKSMTLNTGFVNESISEVIQDLMMSEYVLMTINRTTERVADTYTISQDFRAVVVNTESLTLQKHINDKTINYTIEVEFATPENAML